MRWHNLEDQYYHWLEETCRCEEEKFCNCKSFNQWINDKMELLFGDADKEESCG